MRAEPTPEAVRAAFERLGPVELDPPQVYDDELETVTTCTGQGAMSGTAARADLSSWTDEADRRGINRGQR